MGTPHGRRNVQNLLTLESETVQDLQNDLRRHGHAISAHFAARIVKNLLSD